MIIINIKERKADVNKVNELSNKYNISKDIIAFLLGRNIPEDIIPLLVSKEELPLFPNDSLSNVKEAAELINKYLVNNNANIYIFGDYDSDGVNATYIMYTALSELSEALESGVNIEYYLPNRDEGYGLNMDWCESIDKDSTLVITVDNGISKVEEVEYLKANNVEVLITDHHKPQAVIPDCLIVDAHLNDTEDINACGLCGAAVAYKVIAYLYQDIYEYDYLYVKKYIAHVGIATITDVMPFTKENVIFINNTLKYLNDYPYENEEYSPVTESIYYYAEANKKANLKAKDIAFGFGPQINSCGRMGDIQTAMDFMLATDEDELVDLFRKMDNYNEERKEKTKIAALGTRPPEPTDLALIFKSKDVEGIAGSIASNLCEKFCIPVIVFNESKGILTGSARCPECYNIQWILNNTDHVLTFGGHASAAGLTIKAEDYDAFKESFNKAVSKAPVITSLDNTVYVDKIITSSDLNKYFITQYDNILFFNEFTRPVYALENIQITGYHTSKNNPNNICFHVKTKNKEVKLWCWGFTETYMVLGEPKLVNMIGQLEIFNGMFVINIIDIEAV